MIPSLVLLLLVLSGPARAQAPLAIHGVNRHDYQEWFAQLDANTYRVVYVNAYDTGGSPCFASVARKEVNPPGWEVRSDRTYDEFVKLAEDRKAHGFHPVCVSGYLSGNAPRFAGVWVRKRDPVLGEFGLHLTARQYEERIALARKNAFMPSVVTGYADGAGSYRFTALFVPAGRKEWDERHDLTEEQYQKVIDEQSSRKYRPLSVTAYPTQAGLRFAAVLVKDHLEWYARHGLSPDQYQAEFDEMSMKGFRPVSIAGYVDNRTAGPEAFDQVMRTYMKERGIKAGTLAVSRNGKLLLARGYGFADAEGRRAVQPEDPMRLASVTKAITAAAIHTLVREGKLSLDTRAFPLLGLKPPPGREPDPRLNEITIRHLLEHRGGWDRQKPFDPMFRPLEIAAALDGPGPAGPVDIIRYMMGQPLQFDPGSRVCYSNFGYCVLGRVIEKVSGQTYPAYVQKKIFAPLGGRVELGRSLPRYRNPREPVYLDPGRGRNVLDPASKEKVPAPDGTFYLEAMDAHGGLIASSRDLVRFLDVYGISGEERGGSRRAEVLLGRLPGTFTMLMQRPNGVNLAALFNQESDPSGLDYFKIRDLMEEAADRQTGGQLRYAAVWVKDGG
jgi:N-acyl-D-amino-acid deacylase